jgi:hypothetical protein
VKSMLTPVSIIREPASTLAMIRQGWAHLDLILTAICHDAASRYRGTVLVTRLSILNSFDAGDLHVRI